ncbi:SDR family NAD(P)-dependent oxidoreductase [Kocuria sp.]|uniref:SDR family NAD(P)-dependent oxidoreductase n=1 Tax=Kocuria sp. TaxID=1871328 RepID=UPI0026DDCC8C|nr:SDR family NAD(P)-dependent oxidoreductase [Kocuria sp.]MDO4919022.1 SDR family NAD(P)-dependent oxidoreductase [Kocuria sp.]
MTENPAAPAMLNAEWVEKATPERFAGQTVVVTGAASGIGRAVATRVVAEDGRVVAVDLSEDGLKSLAEELGENLVPVTADLTREDASQKVLDAADGRIDALVNNAGIMDNFSPVHEVTDATWQRVFAVNVEAMMRLTRAVVPLMMEAGHGSVVNLTSEAGLRGSAAGIAYTASKHAVVGMTRNCAFMYATSGLRFNAVAPGGVATGIEIPKDASQFGGARLATVQANMPGVASAAHLASAICFLASDDAVNVNGAVLPSDGGWSAV